MTRAGAPPPTARSTGPPPPSRRQRVRRAMAAPAPPPALRPARRPPRLLPRAGCGRSASSSARFWRIARAIVGRGVRLPPMTLELIHPAGEARSGSDRSDPTSVVVVMPAYNAARTVERTFADIPLEYVDRVLLVDDVSV